MIERNYALGPKNRFNRLIFVIKSWFREINLISPISYTVIYSILWHYGTIRGLTIAENGDCKHSRTTTGRRCLWIAISKRLNWWSLCKAVTLSLLYSLKLRRKINYPWNDYKLHTFYRIMQMCWVGYCIFFFNCMVHAQESLTFSFSIPLSICFCLQKRRTVTPLLHKFLRGELRCYYSG